MMNHPGCCPRVTATYDNVLTSTCHNAILDILGFLRRGVALAWEHRGRIAGVSLTIAFVVLLVVITGWIMSADTGGGLVHAGGLPSGGGLWQAAPASPASPLP